MFSRACLASQQLRKAGRNRFLRGGQHICDKLLLVYYDNSLSKINSRRYIIDVETIKILNRDHKLERDLSVCT